SHSSTTSWRRRRSEGLDHDVERGGEPLPPPDPGGCLWVIARAGCGMAALQILMALGILLAALLSLLLFR
ncbi:MAG TPA: hypothetical protein VHG09_10475, partial [Longimicrobiales bacterium]|nr:hypothetical protein [Longimicrobiales bacterium]